MPERSRWMFRDAIQYILLLTPDEILQSIIIFAVLKRIKTFFLKNVDYLIFQQIMPVMYEKMMATKMEPIDLGATTMTSLPTHHHHPQHHHNIQMISHAHAHHVPATMQPLSQLGMQHHHHSANSSPNPQQMGSVAQDENSPISMISSQVIEKKFTLALLRTYLKGT